MDVLLLILSIVAAVLTCTVLVYALWLAGVSFAAGALPEKKYPKAAPDTFAVIIAARNEEKVIAQLVDSLKKQNYPEAYYRIFVVAHNCTDNTAQIAEQAGAEVFVRHAKNEVKTDALTFGLGEIEKKYKDFFSYIAVFDADALVDENFLCEMNNVLAATGADCAAGYYASKNFGRNMITRLSGMLYHALMHENSIPHGKLGLPVNIYGSGYAVKFKWGKLFDKAKTMVGDFEFSCLMVLEKAKMVAAPRAVIYAEMPEKLSEALSQRMRWAYGDTQCYRKYRRSMRRAIGTHGLPAFKQYIDLIMNPFLSLTAVGIVLWLVIAVLRGAGLSLVVWIAAALLVTYVLLEWMTCMTLKKEKINIRGNLGAVLLMPFWTMLSLCDAVASFFIRDMKWKETVRHSAKSIEDMEEVTK